MSRKDVLGIFLGLVPLLLALGVWALKSGPGWLPWHPDIVGQWQCVGHCFIDPVAKPPSVRYEDGVYYFTNEIGEVMKGRYDSGQTFLVETRWGTLTVETDLFGNELRWSNTTVWKRSFGWSPQVRF